MLDNSIYSRTDYRRHQRRVVYRRLRFVLWFAVSVVAALGMIIWVTWRAGQ